MLEWKYKRDIPRHDQPKPAVNKGKQKVEVEMSKKLDLKILVRE